MADHRINLNLVNSSSGGQFMAINFLKNGFGLGSSGNSLARFPSILTASGVPSNTSGGGDGSLAFDFSVPPSYTSEWVLKYTGTGGCQILVDQTITVLSGGGSASGGTLTLTGAAGRTVFQLAVATDGAWRFQFPATTYTNMGEPVLVRLADEAAYDAGQLFNPDHITAIKALRPKSLRTMQAFDGGAPYYALKFTHDRPQDYVTWADIYYDPALYAASDISATGGAYTCSAAPATPGSITQGEMIFGWCTTGSVGNDTLNVAGRGAKPILNSYTNAGIPAYPATASLAPNSIVSFTYDSVLDSYRNTLGNESMLPGNPISVLVALCNEVECDMHLNLPIMASDADVAAMTTYIRDNLVGTYRPALGNENWGGSPADPSQILVEWSSALFSSSGPGEAYALRYRQLMGIITSAWAPRSPTSLKRVLEWQLFGDATGFLTANEGAFLSAYGYNVAPNRPIDFADSISYANYNNGPNTPAFPGFYLATGQSGLYTAADNYASGNPSLMSSALDWVDNDLRAACSNANGSSSLADILTQETVWETAITSYDVSRATSGLAPLTVDLYEGGLAINAPTVALLNGLGMNGALYGGTANGSAKVTGGRIDALFTGYKNDARCKQLVLDLFAKFISLGHSATPSWFDFVGDFTAFSLYPGDLYSTPFQSFNAIQQWDAPQTVMPLRFRLHA